MAMEHTYALLPLGCKLHFATVCCATLGDLVLCNDAPWVVVAAARYHNHVFDRESFGAQSTRGDGVLHPE